MSKAQIRSSQLITTFGPGAMVDLPEDAVIIAGIDQWRYNRNQALPTVSEPRLQAKLQAILGVENLCLRRPPASVEDRGFIPDITAFRFPEWFIVQHPIRARRAHYETQPDPVRAILDTGNQRMREESEETMALVREAISLPSADFLPIRGSIASPPGLIYC